MNILTGQPFFTFATNYWNTVYGTCNFNPKDFYALNNIPSDKLLNAKTTYAKYDEAQENVILHTNQSFLFTRRGILLTSENLYGKLYDGAFKYPLSSITNISVKIDKNGFGEMIVNEKNIGTITNDTKASFLLNDFLRKAAVQDYSVSRETILSLISPQIGNSFLNEIKNLGISDRIIYKLASSPIEGERVIKHIKLSSIDCIIFTEYRIISTSGLGEILSYENVDKVKFRLIIPHAHAPHGSGLLLKAIVLVAGQVQKQEALSNKQFIITFRDKDYNEFDFHNVSLDRALELKDILKERKVSCDWNSKDFL